MTEQKHAPGPWQTREGPNGTPLVYAGVVYLGALVYFRPVDAALCVAAPELFAALEGLVQAVEQDADGRGVSGFTGARLYDARAAIAKAKGGAP